MMGGWLASARAKHASLAAVPDTMALFAAVADAGAAPALVVPSAFAALTAAGASCSWSALDGHQEETFIGFTEEAYASMRDDESRTPLYARAIAARLGEAPRGTLSVLDIGTGPHAVLALLAAEAGARKVYAVEVNSDAAARARAAVRAAGWAEVVEVIEGFSTEVTLPEKVDLVVSEIVGSVASEEGLYATAADAHARHVLRPTRADSWIPHTVETWSAPCSYALHYALGPPAYDWARLREPLRLSCRDRTLHTLAAPQRVERISFTELRPPLAPPPPVDLVFEITRARLERNRRRYQAALVRHGVDLDDARLHARRAARGLSGLAMWPRLVLCGGERGGCAAADAGAGERGELEGEIVVDSRGSAADRSLTSWQTVLPLLDGRPLPVAPGQVVRARATVALPGAVDEPVQYSVEFFSDRG